MSAENLSDGSHWFVLNFVAPHIAAKPETYINAFNRQESRVELFAPKVRFSQVIDGKVVSKEKLLTYYYVFVKGTLRDVKDLCASQGNGFSFMLDHGSQQRYAVLSEDAMKSFRLIARMYDNTLPFFSIEDIELQEGDLVEVVGGQYAGLSGTFMPKPRSNKGNLVIAATAALGAVVWDIDAKYIRILKFAPNSRRQYDQLDAFLPRLFPILRKFRAGGPLDNREKALLTVFSRRMEAVEIDNRKLQAKLAATLMCVQYILGDMKAYAKSSETYLRRKAAVTNLWSRALIALLLNATGNDLASLQESYQSIAAETGKPTKMQQLILDEYCHCLQIPPQ